MATDKLRLVVLEESELVRAGLRAALSPLGIAVVGEAADGEEAVTMVAELAPAVVTTDLALGGAGGIEATRRLRTVAPNSPVMVLTGSTDHQDLNKAVLAGARGYMLKDARAEAIAGALHAVASGDSVVSSRIAGHLFQGVRAGTVKNGADDRASDLRATLTHREIEVLKLVPSGRENVQIGCILNISPSTVKHHISSILDKLELENRVQAAVFAVRFGVV